MEKQHDDQPREVFFFPMTRYKVIFMIFLFISGMLQVGISVYILSQDLSNNPFQSFWFKFFTFLLGIIGFGVLVFLFIEIINRLWFQNLYKKRPKYELLKKAVEPCEIILPILRTKATNRAEDQLTEVITEPPLLKDKEVESEKLTEFERLRNKYFEEGKLFEDSDFSPAKALPNISITDVKWLRPHQIVENPKLFSDGHSRFDVVQGVLTNCWLMAAMATLTTYDALFDRVVPPDQGFTKKEKYAGIFRFHFWQDGKWIEVIIDDRLPTQKGELVLTHSQEKREFWSALLEKAYAKLYGSYTVLNMGYTSEALRDMTGGLTETICWEPNENPPDNLIDIINTGLKMSSLFGCTIIKETLEARLSNGLISRHAFSVTGFSKAPIKKGGDVTLLRIRNPWGNADEWNGAWSDKSDEWNKVPKRFQKKLKLNFKDDGEFWMEDKDFISNFNKIEICHLGPDVMEGIHLAGNHDLSKNPKWMSAIYHTSFLSRKSAKYRFRISKNENEEDCVLVVAVMQKDRRVNRLDPIHIGFSIVHKSDTIKSRIKFIKKIQLHEVSCSCRVEPGEYTVIPKAEAIVDFMIRVFTNGRIESDQGEISNMDSITTNRSDSVVYNGNKFVKIC